MFRARVAEQSGTLTLATGTDAKHLLCVKPEGPTGSRKPVVFSLSLRLGHSDGYYEEMAASEHLDRLQLEVSGERRRQHRERERELPVLDWPLVRSLLMVCVCGFHVLRRALVLHTLCFLAPRLVCAFVCAADGGSNRWQVVRLTDSLAQILDEADYMKEREVEFHDTELAMERNAQWWPILQICILLLTGVFQVKHLKRFFQQQKILY